MAGNSKLLVYAEGVDVESPLTQFITANSLTKAPSDAQFVIDKGSAAEVGDLYENTTDGKVHHYNKDLEWQIIEDALNNYSAVVSPGISDDESLGYSIGSKWLDTVTDEFFICTDASAGAATWKQIGTPLVGTREIPTGIVNGINVDFNISLVPIDDTILVLRDGMVVPASQFSYSHPTVTFVNPPELAQIIEVQYLTEGIPATVQLSGVTWQVHYHTVIAADITNKGYTLPSTPFVGNTLLFDVAGGTTQIYGTDFIVTGDFVDWNGLAFEGEVNLGDKLRFAYFI